METKHELLKNIILLIVLLVLDTISIFACILINQWVEYVGAIILFIFTGLVIVEIFQTLRARMKKDTLNTAEDTKESKD